MENQQENAHQQPTNHHRIKRLNTNRTKPVSSKTSSRCPRFVARVISLPVAQESLSATQSLISQFGLGRALLDQTHSLIQRTVYHTQTSTTYQTYIYHNRVLQRTIVIMDGWACAILDEIETTVPLIQQPTATILDTLIVQPRRRVAKVMGWTWLRQQMDEGWVDGSAFSRVFQVGKDLLSQNELAQPILSRLCATLSK